MAETRQKLTTRQKELLIASQQQLARTEAALNQARAEATNILTLILDAYGLNTADAMNVTFDAQTGELVVVTEDTAIPPKDTKRGKRA